MFRSVKAGVGAEYIHAHFTNKEKKVKMLQVKSGSTPSGYQPDHPPVSTRNLAVCHTVSLFSAPAALL